MPERARRFESLLFNYETTSRTDYRDGEILPTIKTTYRSYRQPRPRPPYEPLKDIHALTPWRDPNVPFDLYHRPEPIIRTDPRIIQKPYEKPPDVDRAKVQKSRPEVLMTPALNLDKVEEPNRQKFVDYIYMSVTTKSLKDAVTRAHLEGVRAPLSEVYASTTPLAIEPLRQPYVPPEWRMDSVAWDNRQMRTYTEPTRTFWLSREPPYCPVCHASSLRDEARRKEKKTLTST